MKLVSSRRGSKSAKMKTDVEFENPSGSYVKFCTGIGKNDKKIQETTQGEINALQKGIKKCQNEN